MVVLLVVLMVATFVYAMAGGMVELLANKRVSPMAVPKVGK